MNLPPIAGDHVVVWFAESDSLNSQVDAAVRASAHFAGSVQNDQACNNHCLIDGQEVEQICQGAMRRSSRNLFNLELMELKIHALLLSR